MNQYSLSIRVESGKQDRFFIGSFYSTISTHDVSSIWSSTKNIALQIPILVQNIECFEFYNIGEIL